MSTCNIKFNDEYPEVDYDLEGSGDDEDLVINSIDMDGEGPKNFEEFSDDEQEEITMKVLKRRKIGWMTKLLKSVQDGWKLGWKLIGRNELMESTDSFGLTEVPLELLANSVQELLSVVSVRS